MYYPKWIHLDKIVGKDIDKIDENIYSMILFGMKDSYRDFGKYLSDLNQTLKTNRKDWHNLLFIDYFLLFPETQRQQSVLNFIKQNKNNSKLSIYIYRFKNPYFIQDNYHVGTLGTMVRFIPLFTQNRNQNRNQGQCIWSMDIDFNDAYAKHISYNSFPVFEQSDAKCFCGLNTFGDQLKSRTPSENKFVIYAGSFISKTKFPAQLLDSYIAELSTNGNKFPWDYKKSYRFSESHNKFPYGGDEWFLNTYLYQFMKNNNIKTMVEFKADPTIILSKFGIKSELLNKLIKQSLIKQSPQLLLQIMAENRIVIEKNLDNIDPEYQKYLALIYAQKQFYEIETYF